MYIRILLACLLSVEGKDYLELETELAMWVLVLWKKQVLSSVSHTRILNIYIKKGLEVSKVGERCLRKQKEEN